MAISENLGTFLLFDEGRQNGSISHSCVLPVSDHNSDGINDVLFVYHVRKRYLRHRISVVDMRIQAITAVFEVTT